MTRAVKKILSAADARGSPLPEAQDLVSRSPGDDEEEAEDSSTWRVSQPLPNC